MEPCLVVYALYATASLFAGEVGSMQSSVATVHGLVGPANSLPSLETETVFLVASAAGSSGRSLQTVLFTPPVPTVVPSPAVVPSLAVVTPSTLKRPKPSATAGSPVLPSLPQRLSSTPSQPAAKSIAMYRATTLTDIELPSSNDFMDFVIATTMSYRTTSMDFTGTLKASRTCPTYWPHLATITPSPVGVTPTPQRTPPPHALHLILDSSISTVNDFNVNLFLAEFYCVYSQFDPYSVIIMPIPGLQIEVRIYLQNSTLNDEFVKKFVQVWNNETRRHEVFSNATRNQIVGYSYSFQISSTMVMQRSYSPRPPHPPHPETSSIMTTLLTTMSAFVTSTTTTLTPTPSPSISEPSASSSAPTATEPLPARYLILQLGVPDDEFNTTMFLEQFKKYVMFQLGDVVIVQEADKKLRIYVRGDSDKIVEFIDNFQTVWNDPSMREQVFTPASSDNVTVRIRDGLATPLPSTSEPSASTLVPTISEPLPARYLILQLGVPDDEFNTTMFLEQFQNYAMVQLDDIVIQQEADKKLRIYVQGDSDKNDEFIDNFQTVWNDPSTREQVFSSTITDKLISYYVAMDEDTAGLPGWGVALIVVFTLSSVAVVCFCLFFVLRRSKRSKRRRSKRGGVTPPDSFHMRRVPPKDSGDRPNARRFTSRLNSGSRLQVQTRPLNVAGLGTALQAEDQLISEYQGIPAMMASEEEIPRDCLNKNRYNKVLPTPKTRVSLFLRFGQPNSDYINGNFVRGFKDSPKAYIATQGPMETTIDDFWRMVWEQNSSVIFMVTGLQERDVPKCAQYWPDGQKQTNIFYGDLEVTFISSETRDNFLITKFMLAHMEKQTSRGVTHYWFKAWPDFGVPEDPSDLTGYIEAATEDIKASDGPIIVHCSAGIGRTGVIIATHIGMQELDTSRHCNVLKTVWLMRQDRGGAVQTKDQYIFIYMALYAYGTYLESLDKQKDEPSQAPVIGGASSNTKFNTEKAHLLSTSTADGETNNVHVQADTLEADGEQAQGQTPVIDSDDGKSTETNPLLEDNPSTSQATSASL